MPKSFVGLLDNYVEFSKQDREEAIKWEKQLGNDSRTVQHLASGHGGGMGSLPMSIGNVEISFADGITLYNPTTGAHTIILDPDGDAFFGKDVGTPAETSMVVFSNAQKYNTESMGQGDLLVGDNSTGKGNLLWDRSQGKLLFRNGQTVGGSIGSGGLDFTLGSIGGWNFNATTLYDDASTIVLNSSVPSISVASGNVLLNASGITAVAGTIGGWVLGSTTLTGTSIVLDAGNEKITVGSGSPNIVIDGANDLIKSSNFVTRNAGWQIKSDGTAEFADVYLRGKLQAVTIEKQNVSAVGGIIRAVKGSGLLTADFTTPGSYPIAIPGGITVEDNNDGTAIAEVDDVLYIKYWDGTFFSYMWATVTAVGASSGGSRTYSATFEGGSLSHTFPTGEVIVNLAGAGGTGGYTDVEGGSTPRLAVYSHSGSPWAGGGETVRSVIGNLNGYYGAASDYYGFGFGDYTGGNYLSYNADGSDGIELETADGGIRLGGTSGLVIVADSSVHLDKTAVTWRNNADTADMARLYAIENVSSTNYLNFFLDKQTGLNSSVYIVADAASGYLGRIHLSADSNSGASARAEYDLYAYSSGDAYAMFKGDYQISQGGIHLGPSTKTRAVPTGNLIVDDVTTGYGFIFSAASNGMYLGYNAYYDGAWKAWSAGYSGYSVFGDVGGNYAQRWYHDTSSNSSGGTVSATNIGIMYSSGTLTIASGLVVGYASGTAYSSDGVTFYVGTAQKGELYADTSWMRANQSSTVNAIYTPTYWYSTGGFRAGVGAVPTGGQITYTATGGLRPNKNSTDYYVWGMHTQGETTAGAWEGKTGSFGPSIVDLSATFGYPAGIMSVLARVITRSSTASVETTNYMTAGTSTSDYGNCSTYSVGSNWFGSNTSWVDCDANGDIAIRIVASGTQTSYLRLYGYAI